MEFGVKVYCKCCYRGQKADNQAKAKEGGKVGSIKNPSGVVREENIGIKINEDSRRTICVSRGNDVI